MQEQSTDQYNRMSTQTAPSKPSAGVNASSEMPKDGAGLGGNEKDGNQHTLAENTGEGGVGTDIAVLDPLIGKGVVTGCGEAVHLYP